MGLRVQPVPPDVRGNPYLRLLHEALTRRGVEIVDRDPDVLHLHWPEWPAPRLGLRARPFVMRLRRARARGVRVVWTVHNLVPHDATRPGRELQLSASIAATCHALVVHSAYAESVVRGTLGHTGRVVIAPHGDFRDAYPADSRSRPELRAALELPADGTVYLAFGRHKPYKRVAGSLAWFTSSIQDPGARFLVAGESFDPGLRHAVARDDRIVVHPDRIPHDEVAAFHRAADVAVVNHAPPVISSGVIALARSYGLPVIALSPEVRALAESTSIAPWSATADAVLDAYA